MSKKALKKSVAMNRVVAIPSRKVENEDGSVTQLYRIEKIK